jgi:DNA-binding IclR family transcriptional regulator
MISAPDPLSRRILLALQRSPEGLRRVELAGLNHLSLVRTQRIMDGLERAGLVEHDPAYWPRYRLTPAVPDFALEKMAGKPGTAIAAGRLDERPGPAIGAIR